MPRDEAGSSESVSEALEQTVLRLKRSNLAAAKIVALYVRSDTLALRSPTSLLSELSGEALSNQSDATLLAAQQVMSMLLHAHRSAYTRRNDHHVVRTSGSMSRRVVNRRL
jgi:hypothetical protein